MAHISKEGRTALFAAAMHGKLQCLQALLSGGADMNIKDEVS